MICFTLAAMLVAAGLPLRQLGLVAGGGALLVLLFALLEPYRRARLTAFLNPWDHAAGRGLPVGPGPDRDRLRRAVRARAGPVDPEDLLPARGPHRLHPRRHRRGARPGGDLRAAVPVRHDRVRRAANRPKAKGAYAKLLAGGLTSLILCQALLNVYAVLGLAPLTGVPLPFISSGSTSLIVLLGAMGLLLNVAAGGSAHLRAVPREGGRERAARS